MKKFDKWNELKKEIDKKDKFPHFHEREIWFMSVGENIGIEQNGKSEKFLRPVLIIKKFNKEQFLGVMLTSKCKDSKFLFKIKENSCVNLSQIRVFSAKRLLRLKSKLKSFKFEEIISKLFEITLPKKGGLGLNMAISDKIISQNSNKVNFNLSQIQTFNNEKLVYFHQGVNENSKSIDTLKENLLLKNEGKLPSNLLNTIVLKRFNNVKTILFDIVTPKWVLFFKPIIEKLKSLNYYILITTREDESYKETTKLLQLYNIDYISIGEYGGSSLEGKLRASLYRQEKLIDIVKKYNVKTVVSGSVVDINRVGFGLGLKVINFNDMPIKDYNFSCEKITHVTKLTAPFSTVMFKPFFLEDNIFKSLGVCNIKTYNFLDPLIWLKNFQFDINYIKQELPFINLNKKIIIIREEEYKASYVLKNTNFLYEVIEKLQNWDINLIIIPRYESDYLKKRFKKAIVLDKAIKLQQLLAISHLFIGGGGTINIEATYFGVPVISTRSFISHYDKFLIDNNLMYHSNNKNEILNLTKDLINKNFKDKAKNIYSKMEVDIEMFIEEML